MKSLKNLKGAKLLSKKEQKSISGGIIPCPAGYKWNFALMACCNIVTGYCLNTP